MSNRLRNMEGSPAVSKWKLNEADDADEAEETEETEETEEAEEAEEASRATWVAVEVRLWLPRDFVDHVMS